jgi:hypothetical protein
MHLVVSTTIGAKSRLIVATDSSKVSQSTNIEADLKAAYSGIVSGHVSTKWGVTDMTFIQNSRIAFFGYGGDPTLAQQAANSIDTENSAFAKWSESTRTNPGVSSFETKPMWDVVAQIDTDRADAVRDAFLYFAVGMTAVRCTMSGSSTRMFRATGTSPSISTPPSSSPRPSATSRRITSAPTCFRRTRSSRRPRHPPSDSTAGLCRSSSCAAT